MKPLEIKIYYPLDETDYKPTANKQTSLEAITDKFLTDILKDLTLIFEGLTVYPKCFGFWLNPKTREIEFDKIAVIEILTTKSFFDLHKVKKPFFEIIDKIKEDLEQNSVAVVFNHKIEFY